MIRRLGAWLLAALATYFLGSLFMSQVVLARIDRFGVDVDLADRLRMTLADLAGLSTSYLPLIAVAVGIAMLVAALLGRFLPEQRRGLYLLAGLLAPPALIGIMTVTFGMNPLAGSEGVTGLLLQGLAGIVGAYVYCRVVGSPTPEAGHAT
jgi:hypothetical protein